MLAGVPDPADPGRVIMTAVTLAELGVYNAKLRGWITAASGCLGN